MTTSRTSLVCLVLFAAACGGGSSDKGSHADGGGTATETGTSPTASADGATGLFGGGLGRDGAATADVAQSGGGLTGFLAGKGDAGGTALIDAKKSTSGIAGLLAGARDASASAGTTGSTGGATVGLGGAGGAATTLPIATGGTGAGQRDLADGTVGSSCGTCAAGLTCLSSGIPNGYCTALCASQSECGTAGACVGDTTSAICYRVCKTDSDCRPGYSCYSAGTVSVCDIAASTGAGGSTGTASTGTGGSTGSTSSATCDAACANYLYCKGVQDAASQQACVGNCTAAGYSAEILAALAYSDCATTIYLVEGAPPSGTGTGTGSGTGTGTTGCFPDGHTCTYGSECCNGTCFTDTWTCY